MIPDGETIISLMAITACHGHQCLTRTLPTRIFLGHMGSYGWVVRQEWEGPMVMVFGMGLWIDGQVPL